MLADEFGESINLSQAQAPEKKGAFEVEVGGKLVHSKLTMGHGKCQTDEELDAIIASIRVALNAHNI